MSEGDPRHVVDCVGMTCPLPIVHARRALDRVREGELIRVIADDPHAEIDFKAFCLRTGNELIRVERDGDRLGFVIRRRG